MRLKKERHGLVFRYIFSFIVDVRPGSEYLSDKRNKLLRYYYYYYYYYCYCYCYHHLHYYYYYYYYYYYSSSIYKYNGSPPCKLNKV